MWHIDADHMSVRQMFDGKERMAVYVVGGRLIFWNSVIVLILLKFMWKS